MSARVGRSAFHPLLAGAGALICAAGLAIGLTIWWLHLHAINEASSNAGTLATVLAEQANRSVQSVDLVLSDLKKELSSANSVQTNSDDLKGEKVYRLILERLSHLSQAERILVIDRFGLSANTTLKFPSDPVDLSDRDYFQHFKSYDDGRIFISSVIDRRTGKNLVVFSKRINQANGEFAGVVLISVDFTYFEAIYNSISTLHDQTFVLLHRDGKVIVRYLDGKIHTGEKMPATSEWHKYVAQGGAEFKGKSVFDNERRLVAVRPLQDYPLVVNVGVTESAALATWRIQAITIGLGTLLVLFCSSGLLIALNRQFSRVASSELALAKKSKELEKSNATVDAALNNMSQGLVTFDAAATMIICNRRYLQMYGLSEDIAKPGCPLRAILANRVAAGHFRADVIEQYACEIISAAAAGRRINKTLKLIDGRIINVVNEPTADGGWVATHEDITERTQAGDELRRTKKFIDAVIEHVPLPIIVKDVRGLKEACGGRFTLFNRAYEELTGESRTQLIGKTAHELFPKERADLIMRADNEALQQSDQVVLTSEHPIVTAHNGTRAVIAKKSVIRDEDGKPQYLLTVVDDVTERRLSDARIVHLAHHDSLTDLPNRTTFNSTLAATLDRAKASGEQFAVLSIDLDRFKEANDTYGHMVGDTLLREVARRLQVAAAGAFTARLGGDEFVLVVADGSQPATASALADRLLATFRDNFEVEGHQLKLGMSIGVAIYPTDGTDAKALIANADIALYRAKAEFRGSALFYETGMGDRLRERHAMQEDLRLAFDRGELLLHYQPQLKMSGEIVGFEALVRWQCPKRGMVPPGTFIPVAEESGLIIPVGDWVLREACREAASWPQPLTIAVNISPIQFHSGDLPRLIHAILLETGLAPARLELEVTEGVMISDFSRAVSILNQLKSLGVRIAMDDFGTGYSSLSYLQSFRCDKIKIDRVFICDLESNYHSRAIVRAVVGLGQSLNLPVLAEGVETEAQHDYLAQEGCDEVQGYLTGRPQPIEDYAELVGRRVVARQRHAVA